MQEAETFYHINVHCDTTRPYLKCPKRSSAEVTTETARSIIMTSAVTVMS